MRGRVAVALVWLLLVASAEAGHERQISPFLVMVRGVALDYPFWGGIDSPKPSLVDINRDGLVDLLIGDLSGKLSYFRNTGSSLAPKWTPAEDRLGGVQIGTWHVFADIDGDGDQDLFCDPHSGKVAFYRNVSRGEEIRFELVDSAFGGFLVGLYDTPAFADIDNDGDLDFFFGAPSGYLDFYRNVGTAQAPSFQFESDIYDSVLAFPRQVSLDAQHGFSVLRFVDIDGDKDLDLFYGDIFNYNVYFFMNLGTPVKSRLTYQTENYLPLPTQGFNHPSFADLDGDGDYDLVLGVANAAPLNNLIYYQNGGDKTFPFWDIVDSNIISTLDVGSASIPTLGDLDDDGDQDLLIGGTAGRLTYFQNTGTAGAPVLTFVTDSFMNISVGLSSAPALVDWDSDGDLDLLIGTDAGRIEYWRNTGSKANFVPVRDSAQLGGIKVDHLATPCPADFNGDGLVDLAVGEWDFNNKANILLYGNIGTKGASRLALQTSTLLKVDTARSFTLPTPSDWNADGKIDLIVGGIDSGLSLYLNQASAGSFPDSLTLVRQTTVLPGSDDGLRLKMAVTDINADGAKDLFIGEGDGGLNFYRGGSCCDGKRGNIDASTDGMVDLVDLSYLIAYLVPAGSPVELPCRNAANVFETADQTVDMSDLVMLIALLTGQASSWPLCQ